MVYTKNREELFYVPNRSRPTTKHKKFGTSENVFLDQRELMSGRLEYQEIGMGKKYFLKLGILKYYKP